MWLIEAFPMNTVNKPARVYERTSFESRSSNNDLINFFFYNERIKIKK